MLLTLKISHKYYEGNFNDLWLWDTGAKAWTWIAGNQTRNQVGVYGVKGLGASSNIIGARYGQTMAVYQSTGTILIFGGQDANGI